MRPPLDAYDVLIHLNPKQVPLLAQAVDPHPVTFSRGLMAGRIAPSGGALPVIDYNPVSLYLAELRVSFLSAIKLRLKARHAFDIVLLTQHVRKAVQRDLHMQAACANPAAPPSIQPSICLSFRKG